jgi:hypothetical protein
MSYAYSISAEDLLKIYPEAVVLAKEHGKKEGDDFGEEMFIIAKKYGINIDPIGCTEKDASLLTGDLREEGKKVINLNEEMARRKNDNEKEI